VKAIKYLLDSNLESLTIAELQELKQQFKPKEEMLNQKSLNLIFKALS